MFLAILSHDLRNPLNTIRMAASVVALATQEPGHCRRDVDDHEEHRCDDAIDQRPDRLLICWVGPRDAAESRAGRSGRALPRSDRLVSHRAPGTYAALSPDGDVNGVWDAGRIRQVIANLLGNAIQHGSPEGPIDLTVSFKRNRLQQDRRLRPKDPPWC